MVQFVEDRAREQGIGVLFALSTQAFNFFQSKLGFAQGTGDVVPPPGRVSFVGAGRRSRVLLKKLS
jgi:amino-acid N-acetyltransferase